MDERLDGRTALVTAASKGIGKGIAEILVRHGARVVVTGRTREPLEAVVEQLGNDRALGVVGDANDPDHQADTVTQALDTFGSLDILVNNVGAPPRQEPLMDVDIAAFRAALDTSLIAHLAWTQVTWRAFMRDHGGVVLNMSSIAGLSVFPGGGAYTVGKAAVVQLTRQMALELAPAVRVNALAPGFTRTDFTSSLLATNEQTIGPGIPMARVGEPTDIGQAAIFLVSDAASWITGQTLVVDGGKLLLRG